MLRAWTMPATFILIGPLERAVDFGWNVVARQRLPDDAQVLTGLTCATPVAALTLVPVNAT